MGPYSNNCKTFLKKTLKPFGTTNPSTTIGKPIKPSRRRRMRKQEELQKRFNELFTDKCKQNENEIEMLMQPQYG